MKETKETCFLSNHPPGVAQIAAGILYFATMSTQTDIIAWELGTKVPLLNRKLISVPIPSKRLHGSKRILNEILFSHRTEEEIQAVRQAVVPTAIASLARGRNILIYPAGRSAPVGEAKWQRGIGQIVQGAYPQCDNLSVVCVHTPRKGFHFQLSEQVSIGEIINEGEILEFSPDEITRYLYEYYTSVYPLDQSGISD